MIGILEAGLQNTKTPSDKCVTDAKLANDTTVVECSLDYLFFAGLVDTYDLICIHQCVIYIYIYKYICNMYFGSASCVCRKL